MEQLVKVTSTPFQAIRFTQSARLVPSDNIDVERRKAVARHFAFTSRYCAGGGSVDLEYINKVNDAFSKKSSSVNRRPPVPQPTASQQKTSGTNAPGITPPAVSSPVPAAADDNSIRPAAVSNSPDIPVSHSYSAEVQAAYTVQRGSLELRVAKGDLAFVPPLVMTIITQYPEIHFEYTGDFNYVPPRDDPGGNNVNLFT